MIRLAQEVAEEQNRHANWRMIINGGVRQDIGQVHGHLIIADNKPADDAYTVIDPTSGFEDWEQIFSRVRNTVRLPDVGYSLIFHLEQKGNALASLSVTTPN